MEKMDFLNFYWQYYLNLEDDFSNTTKFVTLDEDNFKTFSIVYQKLLLAVGSECEVLFKELCGFGSEDFKKISDYKAEIKSRNLMPLDNNVRIMRFSKMMKIAPLGEEWPEKTPYWWKKYNEVKHGRSMNYRKANLKNILYALASLYLLEEYLYKKIIKEGDEDFIRPESNLFTLSWKRRFSSMNGAVFELVDETSNVD